MTERQFLDRQSRRLRDRIRRRSASLHDQVESAIGPSVREHPRTSVAAGASAGLLLGRALGLASRPRGAAASPGIVASGVRIVTTTGMVVLRSMIAGSLRPSVREGAGNAEPPVEEITEEPPE